MSEDQSALAVIATARQRIQAHEEVSDADLMEVLLLLRAGRASAATSTATKKKKADKVLIASEPLPELEGLL